MAATLHDVARLANVSVKTVSNVINDFPHIRPTTRERVERAIRELDYRPNLTARNLRSGRTGSIALALPELSLSYFAELADAVIEAADRRGLSVLIQQTGSGNRDREIELLKSPRLQLTDGLIFSPLGMSQDDVDLLAVPYPLVVLGERIFDGPADHVTMRNVEAAAAATRHLLDRGCRRIAVIGAHEGEVVGSAALRMEGYRKAYADAGMEVDERLVRYVGLWHRLDGAQAMRELIAEGIPFDGVFGLNDTLALGALRALQEARIAVPDEVLVIGFDDLDEGQYSLPALSTIDPGRSEIAETAVRVLAEQIAQRDDPTPPQRFLVDYRVVERESTRR